MRRALVAALALALLTSVHSKLVAQTALPACHPPARPRQVAELFFGRGIGGRLVSEAAWTRFVTRELTSRFPDGLTVTDAKGQWRNPSGGPVIREPAKRVEIALLGAADDQARLDAVVTAYKHDFHQRSVLVIVQAACVSF